MREIKRILIANRGEIALRALRTIQEMGKEAVVVHSTADKDALYVKYADATIVGGIVKHNKLEINEKVIDVTIDKINKKELYSTGNST